ncbi:MAG: chemotaxis protein CheW [Solirubrobacteraceae bacterium]|nr:chemotaxis protein CheW [Solirubrobacteraceae bacterium]
MSANHVQQLVAFTLGAEEYALPIDEVQEIIRYTPPRSVAATDDAVRGVIALRGKIVPVHDLDRQLGLPSRDGEPTKIVMVESAGGHVGIVVDDVTEVLTVDASQIEPAPMSAAAVAGIAQVGDRLVVVLDTAALFGDVADAPHDAVATPVNGSAANVDGVAVGAAA